MLSSRARTGVSWAAQLVAAGILGFAGVAKITAAPDSVALFTVLGAEPWGRLLVGTLEVAASLLLLWPRTVILGAGLGVFLMTGAIATHLFKVGIAIEGDPTFFILACVVLIASTAIILLRVRPSDTSAD